MGKPAWAVIIFLILMPFCADGQNKVFTLEGYITDSKGNTLVNATIRTQNNRYAVTDTSGYYEINIPFKKLPPTLKIEVQYVGKKTYRKKIAIPEGVTELRHDVSLENLDLYMDEITVSAEQADESVSNSTYVIDRMAIEQSQSYTLGNLLELIPGQSITNPSLQGAQTINFRSELPQTIGNSNQYNLNNAFGIGFFLNGQALNNNTNMQALNPISNTARPFRTFGGSRINDRQYSSGDTPGGGFDLREIPVGNIEKVEVVQGVASAKYGDIMSGGVFIETIAGSSPWNASFRRSGGEISLGMNKGFRLHPRHAVNVSVDYLFSNSDPRDRLKTFNRLSTSAMWTSYYGENRDIKNTLSLSYRTNLDDLKSDPDLGIRKKTYYQNKRLSFSNRLRIQADQMLFDNVTFSISANAGKSISYTKEYVNAGVRPVTDVTREGVFEGTYHPPNYFGEMSILGKPVSLNSRIDFNRALQLGDWDFNISYGANTNFDANYGKGRVFNPLRPIQASGAATNRPISYKELRPEAWQAGAYVESTISGDIFDHKTVSTIGLRGDIQHGYKTLSPRINTRFYLTDKLSLTGAYGIQTKAPGLIHLYPGPDYEDFTLLNSYNGNVTESIFLAYTNISTDVVGDLEPMKSYRSEVGLQWEQEDLNISATFYRNITANGIALERRPKELNLPVYEITDRPEGEPPVYENTGETRRVIYGQGYLQNTAYTRNWGIELTASTPKIESIQTSFSLSTSFSNSFYYNEARDFNINTERIPQPEEEIWYGIYPSTKNRSGRWQALLTSMHHISELGLLLTIRSEAFLYNYNEILSNSNRAIAYVSNDLEVVPIPEDEINDPKYDKLDRAPTDGTFTRTPSFVYFNFHANVSKNIGEHVRLSFFANNFLNIRPEATNSEGEITGTLNQQPYFGMELRLTL